MTKYVRITWGNEELHSHLGFAVHLTQRQREVLILLCEGLPNKLIGRHLGVSDNTVKTHVASVLRSLNVATRLEAVTVAFKLGLVQSCEEPPRSELAGVGADQPRELAGAVLTTAMHSPILSPALEANEGRRIS